MEGLHVNFRSGNFREIAILQSPSRSAGSTMYILYAARDPAALFLAVGFLKAWLNAESSLAVLAFVRWLLKSDRTSVTFFILRFQGPGPWPKPGSHGFSDLGGPGSHFLDFGSLLKPSTKASEN